jgi:ribonuclease R
LAFPYYTHFTSPIRRYPDLMVHRLLDRYLAHQPSVNKEQYEEYCKHCSDMERQAMEAERNSIKYKQAEYLSDKIGQEFDAVVSGISKWGVYAELKDSHCEGMIPMRSFDDLQQAVKDAGDQMLVIKGIFPTGKRGGFVVYLQNE